MRKSLQIIEDGEEKIEFGEESVESRLDSQLGQMATLARDLAKSKKLQFLTESKLAFNQAPSNKK